jgi:hypothetical protein
MPYGKAVWRTSIVLSCALLVAAPLSAQGTPPGPGWQASTCQSSYPSESLRFLLSDNNYYYWTVRLDLINYAGGVQSHANYGVFPYSSYIKSAPNGSKTAEWINGEVDMFCWERHTVINGVNTTDFIRNQGPYVGGNFQFVSDDADCEEGNIVDENGVACPDESTSTGGGSTDNYEGEQCSSTLITVEENDGAGWYEIWSGYASVCTT